MFQDTRKRADAVVAISVTLVGSVVVTVRRLRMRRDCILLFYSWLCSYLTYRALIFDLMPHPHLVTLVLILLETNTGFMRKGAVGP